MTVYPVLPLEERATHLVALGFDRLDLLLTGELFFERGSRGHGASNIPDPAVDFFDFPLETQLQILRPIVEHFRLRLEEASVALGDRALDLCASPLGEGAKRLGQVSGGAACYPAGKREQPSSSLLFEQVTGLRHCGEKEMILGLRAGFDGKERQIDEWKLARLGASDESFG